MDTGQATEALTTTDLVVEWRREADRMEARGLDQPGKLIRSLADQLAAVLQHEGSAILSLREASAESGYSEGHLGRKVRAGEIPNAGRPGAPRIRRCDVPKKPGRLTKLRAPSRLDESKAAIVRSIANQGS
jgi:hypothetical protein